MTPSKLDRPWIRGASAAIALALAAGATAGPSAQGLDVSVDAQTGRPEKKFPARVPNLTPPIQHFGALSAAQVRSAIGLAAADVVSIGFNGSDGAGLDVFNSSVASFPVAGTDYLVMSTGNTSSALTANNSNSTSTELGGLNNSQGNDLTQIVMVLHPPPGATCFAFDFRFFSEEFPEFVGSQYNDAFIAELGQSTFQIVNNQVIAPNNFAFDAQNHVVSINTTFGVTAGAASGTTYDGATPLLTAVTPIEVPGSDFTVTLSITDLGDSIYDSTVFIDNARWFFGLSCLPGADADSDGDDLLDDWETNGIDFDNDGTVDLDLPAMGADPDHKDIFVEIDYMVLAGVGGHTHKPKLDALQIVIDAFNNANVTNPDGVNGIHIHIDGGADSIMNPVTNATWGTRTRSDELAHQDNLGTGTNPYSWAAFDAIKGVGTPGSFSIERANVFHYCIFAHNLSTGLGSTSGIARGIPASDFLVTLGGWTGSVGTTNEQGGTLMHELGHDLGLRHGGNDHGNYKPNYLSVMNYFFQTRGLRFNNADGRFDYSRFLLPNLNEGNLDETAGIGGVPAAADYGTRFWAGGSQRITNDINVGIDWNNDGDATDVGLAADINNSGGNSVLGTANNWADLRYDGGAVGHLGEMIVLPAFSEPMDIDEPTNILIPTEFAVCIGGPGKVVLPACKPETYTVTIVNKGFLPDTYSIQVAKTQNWIDTSGVPSQVTISAGGSHVLSLPVLVPQGTPNGTVGVLVIQVASTANAAMKDSLTTTTTASSTDTDGDGLTDECDACPSSNLAATIVIGSCDSNVPNLLFADGCTMSDLIAECQAGTSNHGAFVSCVSHLTNAWKAAGLITGAQKGAILSCAAQSGH